MNSQQLFEALYEQHASAIKGYAMRRIEPSRADDIVAEVFLVAWRRLEDIPSEPRPWLFGVATRVLANERRRAARQRTAFDRLRPPAPDLDPAEFPTPANHPIREALGSLSDTDREALLLIAWEGLTHREAARALGVKEATFTVRLHRAKRRLGRAIQHGPPARTPPTRLETP